jgi:hypothetical protein
MEEFICPVCGHHTKLSEDYEAILQTMNAIGRVTGYPEYKAYCENCENVFPVVDDLYKIDEITNLDGEPKQDEKAQSRIGRKVIIGELEVGKRSVLPYWPDFKKYLYTTTVMSIISTSDAGRIAFETMNSVYSLVRVDRENA